MEGLKWTSLLFMEARESGAYVSLEGLAGRRGLFCVLGDISTY